MDWIKYWYGQGLRDLCFCVRYICISIINTLSMPVLLKTLFDPWKKDELSGVGLSLQQKFQLFWLNVVSRFIGFIIRSIAFLLGCLGLLGALGIGGALFIVWIFMPLISISLIAVGFGRL